MPLFNYSVEMDRDPKIISMILLSKTQDSKKKKSGKYGIHIKLIHAFRK